MYQFAWRATTFFPMPQWRIVKGAETFSMRDMLYDRYRDQVLKALGGRDVHPSHRGQKADDLWKQEIYYTREVA